MSIDKLHNDVADLQKNYGQISALVDRLDTTIEKLSDLSNNISRLLAVHEHKIEHQEKQTESIMSLIEKRKQESDQVMRDLKREFNDEFQNIMRAITTMTSDHNKQHAELDVKMKSIEKFLWVATGGAAVIGFIISNLMGWVGLFK